MQTVLFEHAEMRIAQRSESFHDLRESLARKDFYFRVVHEHHECVGISGIVDRHLEEIDHAVDVCEACHFLLLRFSAICMSVFRDTIVSSC